MVKRMVFWAACGLVVAGAARGAEITRAAWEAEAGALKQQPGLVRFYSFKTREAVQQIGRAHV